MLALIRFFFFNRLGAWVKMSENVKMRHKCPIKTAGVERKKRKQEFITSAAVEHQRKDTNDKTIKSISLVHWHSLLDSSVVHICSLPTVNAFELWTGQGRLITWGLTPPTPRTQLPNTCIDLQCSLHNSPDGCDEFTTALAREPNSGHCWH